MSVNTKMTALADKVRSLLGLTGKLGLDAMATNLTTANTEVAAQEELMGQIITALAEKSAGAETAKEEQEKTIDITENGTTEVTPDSGKVLSKVTVNVEVESGGGDPYAVVNSIINGTIEEFVSYESGYGCPLCSDGPDCFPNIKRVILPNCKIVQQMKACYNLEIYDTSGTYVGSQYFNNCMALKALVLRSSIVATLANSLNAINNTPINKGSGYVYVRRNLIQSYQTATNWSVLYANQPNMFRALEDYTVDGTITGALDESKI